MAVTWITLYSSLISFSRIGRAGLTQSFVTLRSQMGRAGLSSESPVASVALLFCRRPLLSLWSLAKAMGIGERYFSALNHRCVFPSMQGHLPYMWPSYKIPLVVRGHGRCVTIWVVQGALF
jgi:hypothetical protein